MYASLINRLIIVIFHAFLHSINNLSYGTDTLNTSMKKIQRIVFSIDLVFFFY